MGVSIEVYRSRIGSHHNFTHCPNRIHCLKGKFWNQILLMFYLNTIYFPYVKSQLKRKKRNREVCQWYVQMVCYAVYVPLLLRLSNDVEENPGPRTINDIVDPTYTIHADFNQGNELMFGMNAGKQCVAMSLYAIVYKEIKSVNIWDRLILNSILICGNSLYGIISQCINKSYLLLTDVPEFVDIENHVFNLQYSPSISGALHMIENSLPHVTLEHALNKVFVSMHYNSCLLTIGMNTVAIMMPFPGVFKVFDSHSRDVFGRPSAFGYCVLISVEGLENLEEYFRFTSRSNCVIPFELKGVTCIATVLSARVITNSGLVGSTEAFKHHDVNNKRSNTKKVRRQNESTEQREARLAKMREYNILKRQNETAQQKKARLAKERERKRASRKRASSQKQGERKGKCSSHQIEDGASNPVNNSKKGKRQNETSAQREARLAKMREYGISRKRNETADQREARLAKMREYDISKKQNETADQREARLAKMREYDISKKQNETTELREARLAKKCQRMKASRKKASSQKQGERKGDCRSHQTGEGFSNPVSSYFPNENIDELALVRKFHNSVSAGPLYICTCCDQLWYKHSVLPAERLKLINPDITKYLQSIRSVDDTEWICQTCNNHLKKGKVPPCAIANGMQFPEKPTFFDLNELECRLCPGKNQKIFVDLTIHNHQ